MLKIKAKGLIFILESLPFQSLQRTITQELLTVQHPRLHPSLTESEL